MKYYLYITLATILGLTGCKKFLDIDSPEDQLVTENVFTSNETAVSAIIGLYGSMMANTVRFNYFIPFYTGLYADELDYKLTATGPLMVYQNSLFAKDALTNQIWTDGYNFIYQANSLLKGLENARNLSSTVKSQLQGEALFLRAFWHFYLVNLYGDIPWVGSTDYSINAVSMRNPAGFVYEQMIKDLLQSKQLLNEKYMAANTISTSEDRVRPNVNTAMALLARIYLYREKWGEAEAEASSIIAKNQFYQLEPIGQVFKRTSKEAIWSLELPTTTSFYNSYEAYYFTLNDRPSGETTRSTTLSVSLLNLFTADDLRKTNWIDTFSDASGSYVYPAKYKSLTDATIDEYSICFRLAETYLIRAEARAKLNKLGDAINDLDAIRARAGLSLIKNTDPGISQQALLNMIQLERQKELFCEYGHRWFDLKRTGTVDEVMNAINSQKQGSWTPLKSVWPIPQNDIDNNRNLIQNDGYN